MTTRPSHCRESLLQEGRKVRLISYFDLFAGIGGFRAGLERAEGFRCVGHCEIDRHAHRSYCAIHHPREEECYYPDVRAIDPETLPHFDLLCGGFPCQSFSQAGSRRGFDDPRGALFFQIARLAAARRPAYLLLENVFGLLSHDQGRTFAVILSTLSDLGYCCEWMVLNSAHFGVPQSRRRVFLVGYLDPRCAGEIFPVFGPGGKALVQILGGSQGSRVYDPSGVACTQTASAGGAGGKTGLYFIDLFPGAPQVTEIARCITTGAGKSGFSLHRREKSGVVYLTQSGPGSLAARPGRIRRLMPRECLRLQGFAEDQIDRLLAVSSDAQAYRQAGNSVTVPVVEAIARKLRAVDERLKAGDLAA